MPESRFRCGIRTSADTRPDVIVAQVAVDEWGVLSLPELVACGLSKWGVLRRERHGRLHSLYPGVYAVGYPLDLPEARYLAAVKAAGVGAVSSHRAAGWLWQFLEGDEPKPEVTIPGPGTRTIDGIVIHRSLLTPRDRARHRGVPITSAARTIVDLAAVADEPTLRHALRRAQGHRRVSIPSLLDTMQRLGPRRGSATLRRLVATGPTPTRSVLEDVVLDLLLAAGFEHPDVNKPLVVGGRRVIPDFRWPKQRLILEADGAGWHDQTLDAERQAVLEAHGERVLRVTWEQAVGRPHATVARIAAAGAPAGRSGGWHERGGPATRATARGAVGPRRDRTRPPLRGASEAAGALVAHSVLTQRLPPAAWSR